MTINPTTLQLASQGHRGRGQKKKDLEKKCSLNSRLQVQLNEEGAELHREKLSGSNKTQLKN